MLVDSHCHLDLLADADGAIKRAKEAGVKYMQTVATSLDNMDALLAFAEKYPEVFASVGMHPCSVKTAADVVELDKLLKISQHPKVIAFGETGLDYYHPGYSKIDQRNSLLNHIYASQQVELPVIIHNRNSDDDCQQILAAEYKAHPFNGLIHCFASDLKFAKAVLDIGFYISIAGIITFKNNDALVEVVRYTPLDMLLVETDSPYLAPIPMRGKKNEPAFVNFVAAKIAELKGLDLESVKMQTTNNFFNLFTKAGVIANV